MTSDVQLVCISRAAAAGGEDIGWLVAERLGLRYVDEEIISVAAERAGIDPALVAEAEAPKSMVARLVEAIDSIGTHKVTADWWLTRPSRRSLRALIRETIRQVAERGHAVIVAHAASMALGPRPGVLRVFVTGTPEARVERLHEIGLSQKDAEMAIEESDRSRRQYLESFYGVSNESPTHYDLVINTDRISVDRAVALVLASVGG